MGYILKNTSGLVNTKLTDTARKKISEGKFNISYFQVGDSEVSYNTLPNTYNQMNTRILEPEFNSQNSTGIPQSNKQNVKYPFYVDPGSSNTYGVPFMASISNPVYNRAAIRGFFEAIYSAETLSWSALTNDKYAINANYVVDMSTLTCTDNITLIPSECYTDPVRPPQAGDLVTIFYDGNGMSDCSCTYPPPTPTPCVECWTTGFTLSITGLSEGGIVDIFQFTDSGQLYNGKPIYVSIPFYYNIYWEDSKWVCDYFFGTTIISNTPLGSFETFGFGTYQVETYCGNSTQLCIEFCDEFGCEKETLYQKSFSGETYWSSNYGTEIKYSSDTNSFVVSTGIDYIAFLSGKTSTDIPIGSFEVIDPTYTTITVYSGYCSGDVACNCLSFTASTGDDLLGYLDCTGIIHKLQLTSGGTFENCILDDYWWSFSGTSVVEACLLECSPVTTILSVEPCITPSPTPTPSPSFCPPPTPSPACPLPPDASCLMSISSCYQMMTYRITRVCGDLIYLDRNTPDFSQFSTCYGRVIIYPPNINEIYDSYTPRPHWNDNVIDFESVCGLDALDVKIWNMNIPWSENPAGLNPTYNEDYTNFGSIDYLGSKEYFGYASKLGQVFLSNFSTTPTTATTDTFYFNSLGDQIFVEPKDQKAIAIIHYTNNTIDFFYGEKFALEPYDVENPQDTTGQARNFKIHIPWLMWHKNPQCCLGETFWVDPAGFEKYDLFEPHYVQSLKNNDMNSPGIRYYHLWDTHPNINGIPNRVGKVFPDYKIIIIDDEELIAALSYKSNRNWTLPAPRTSLIAPNSCGLDNNSITGILTGNGQTLYVTYRLSDDTTCSQNLHCNYYSTIQGPNLNCNNIQPQNVAVRFGSEFPCMNTATQPPPQDCWVSGFTFGLSQMEGVVAYVPMFNSGIMFMGQNIYTSYYLPINIYWDGMNWNFITILGSIYSGVINSSSPISTFDMGDGITGITECGLTDFICVNICTETCTTKPYVKFNLFGDTTWTPIENLHDEYITYSASTNSFVYTSGSTTPFAILSGKTENDYPIGDYQVFSPVTGITVTSGYCQDITYCVCKSITATTGDVNIFYTDCDGIIQQQFIQSGLTFSGCMANLPIYYDILVSFEICDSVCPPMILTESTTTTTTCPVYCDINQGFLASKFEIICQLVEGEGRPDSSEWKILDFTNQISGTSINGYITQSGLTGSTFVITLDDYNSAPYYDLNDYISLPVVNSTGYTLNFGDEYYFYGNVETDIEATIYEMRYKINLSQAEFQLSSNPSWSAGTPTYISEIGLYDNEKNLMVISKLQSPVLRQGVQQFLVKFDF